MAARRAVLATATAVLLAGAVALAGLDLTGHLPGGLVADPTTTSTPSIQSTSTSIVRGPQRTVRTRPM